MEPHFRLHYFEPSGDLEQSQPDLREGHPLPLRSFQHGAPEAMLDRVGHRVQKQPELVGRRFLRGFVSLPNLCLHSLMNSSASPRPQ
jgi:hypothetical protein